ncbi:MAG: BatA domain-containing protein [Candidatus Omnitrophica bacterium]|nr:BatA domain-containing protein [Candidatus Omnitrophota bacterium]
MAFLYPIFLFGLLAAGLPVLIHLLTRKNKKTIIFSDLTLLQKIDAEESARYKFENLILMLLRALLCLLLALLFCQPVMKAGEGAIRRPGKGTVAAIVLDNSRSMDASEGGVKRYQRAREKALEILDQLRGEDEAIAVFASSKTRSSHASPTPYREEVRDAIDRSEVSPFSSSFATGVQLALEAVLKSNLPNKEIYLFTDGQKVAFESVPTAWPTGSDEIAGYFGYLGNQSNLPNVEISDLDVSPLSAKPGEGIRVTVEAIPHGNDLPNKLQVSLETGPNNRISNEAPIASGNPTTVEFNTTRSDEAVETGKVEIQADVLDSDNTAYYALPQSRPIQLVMSQGGGSERTLLFLQNALTILAKQPFIPKIKAEVVEFWDLPKYVAGESVDVAIVANPGNMDDRWVRGLSTWMREGGQLFLALGPIARNQINQYMVPQWFPDKIQAWEVDIKDSATPISLDYNHPWLDRFEDQEESNWQRVQFWRGWEFETPLSGLTSINPMITLSNGAPALWEREVGLGKLSVLMTSLDDEWNDLPRQGMYLAFWGEFLRALAERKGLQPAFSAGSQVPIEAIRKDDRPTEITIIDPEGHEFPLSVAGQKLNQSIFFSRTDRVGIYQVEYEKDRISQITPTAFAVNIEPGEGDLALLSGDEIRELFPFPIQTFKEGESIAGQLVHARFGYTLWPIVLAIVVAFMFIEARLARPV